MENGANIYPSAYGKVPHVVAEKGFHRWGFLRLSAGSCGNGFGHQQKTKTKTKKEAKGNQKGTKVSQKGAKGSQKGAKDQENHQKSYLGAFEVFFFFFIKFFSSKL